jgi:hypothetical protein
MRRRLESPALPRGNQIAWTEEARRNRSANFLLRGALGMLARVRHAVCHRRMADSDAIAASDSVV